MKTNLTVQSTSRRRPTAALIRAAVLGLGSSVLVFLAITAQAAGIKQPSTTYYRLATYPNPAPAANEEFGNAVAWLPTGSGFVAGARGDRLGGLNPVGAVYVLTTTTGAVRRVITETAGAALDYFGYSIAVSGTEVLVGDQLDDHGATNAGAAYLYDTNSGGLLQSFYDPSAVQDDKLGTSVAIVSDTAVLVGVPYYSTNIGRAYLCRTDDGTCLNAIDSPGGDGGNFGLSVVALGDKFAVAAPFAGQHGKVYVFTTTSGSLYRTLELTTTLTGDNFGSALAAVGGNVLIGAQNGPTNFVCTPGAAYLYAPNGTRLQSFSNPDTSDCGARFGAAVAGDVNLVLIGAPGANGNEGRAYVFNATTGALVATLKKDTPSSNDYFGNSVAIRGENFLVGAPDDGLGEFQAGAVYRFGIKTRWDLYLPLVEK